MPRHRPKDRKLPRIPTPQVISMVEPPYPIDTVAAGTVVLEMTTGASAEIDGVRVVQGPKGFTPQAIEAGRKWKFQPAELDGNPATVNPSRLFLQSAYRLVERSRERER